MKKLVIAFVVAALAAAALVPTVVLASPSSDDPVPPQPQAAPPWVGLVVRPLSSRIAERLGLGAQEGLLVLRVVPHGPAGQAGLKRKDVITAVNGTAVTKVSELVQATKAAGQGGTLAFTVLRDGQTLPFNVLLAERPAPPKPERFQPFAPFLGLALGRIGEKLHQLDATFEDKDGNVVTVRAVAGTVSAKSEGSLTLQPNGGGPEQTIPVTADVVLLRGGKKVSLEEAEIGDRAVVVWQNGAVKSIFIGPFHPLHPGSSPGAFLAPGLGDHHRQPLRGWLHEFKDRGAPMPRDRSQSKLDDVLPPWLRGHQGQLWNEKGKALPLQKEERPEQHQAPSFVGASTADPIV